MILSIRFGAALLFVLGFSSGCTGSRSTSARTTPPPATSPRGPDVVTAIRTICPPIAAARCEALARCPSCVAREGTCIEREEHRCEGWLDATVLLGIADPAAETPQSAAIEACIRETREAVLGASSCYASTPARSCLRLLDSHYRPAPEPTFTHGSRNGRGERCESTFECDFDLACVDHVCRSVAHCDRVEDDCGRAMACVPDAHRCEPRSCDPWRFWNTDMIDN